MEFLRDPRLIPRIQEDMTNLGYVGEDANKVLLYFVGFSRKQRKPLSAELKGPSALGKSEMLKTVSGAMPPEDIIEVSRLTPQALAYLPKDALSHKFLTVMERGLRGVGLQPPNHAK